MSYKYCISALFIILFSCSTNELEPELLSSYPSEIDSLVYIAIDKKYSFNVEVSKISVMYPVKHISSDERGQIDETFIDTSQYVVKVTAELPDDKIERWIFGFDNKINLLWEMKDEKQKAGEKVFYSN